MKGVAPEPVIGLEVHAQVRTRSKMFCRCSAAYAGAAPNTHVCAICAGMPGALPVINRKAVDGAILTALALHCDVPLHSKFDRKNYTYPDLPKGYQITQYDRPVGLGGWLTFALDREQVRCGIVRVHLEEDTGKSIHQADGRNASLVDYNRSGVPLLEIVGEPDLRSPLHAREFFAALRQTLMYLGVSDGNLESGSMRADVNVSVRKYDGTFGTKVEIKNLNSFRAVQRALEFEIERQRDLLAAGREIEQETRGWSESEEKTVSQRIKEYAHDYRYFPEPDLPPLVLSRSWVNSRRQALPEMPAARRERLERQYSLVPAAASVLAEDRGRADFFEEAVRAAVSSTPRPIATWLLGDVLRLVNESGAALDQSRLTPSNLACLVDLVESKTIGGSAAKEVLEAIFRTGENAEQAARRLNLLTIDDLAVVERIVDGAIAANPRAVADYKRGKTKAIQALVGGVTKASRGTVDQQEALALIRRKLDDE